MKINSMFSGLTNRDFSVIGTLAGSAAKSAVVSGMMYPFTEVAYGATNKLVDAILPSGIRQPLPNGYKPQELKNDPTSQRTSSNEERAIYFNNVAKYLDKIDNKTDLKNAISAVDPKYSFELYHYLESRGLEPASYMKLRSSDHSSVDMATKAKKPSSEDAIKKAIPWALVGLAGTSLLSPTTTDPQLQYQNRQKAIRNGLFLGLGSYLNKMGYLNDFKSSFGFGKDKEEDKPDSKSKSKSKNEQKFTADEWLNIYNKFNTPAGKPETKKRSKNKDIDEVAAEVEEEQESDSGDQSITDISKFMR